MKEIPVIDLFAGPGGLGEGFSSFSNKLNEEKFKIKLSIEKDKDAHSTLELRSFYRQFLNNNEKIPDDYYSFLKGTITRENLFNKYSQKAEVAIKEAWCAELGKINEAEVDDNIRNALVGTKDWVLIGGPPCQAYSLVGRSRVGGIDENDHRVYLYEEYLRIIAFHKPAVFVMENVKGLLSAKIDGKRIFSKIKKDLSDPITIFPKSKSPKYRIYSLIKNPDSYDYKGNPVYESDRDFLIETEKFEIPQRRHRIILLGVREDVKFTGKTILVQKPEVKLKDVIGDLPIIRSVISRKRTGYYYSEDKLKSKYEKIVDSNNSWSKYLAKFKKELCINNSETLSFKYNNGSMFIPIESPNKITKLNKWFKDDKIGGVCNHESRSHLLSDLKRYIFAANYMAEKGVSPKLYDYPDNLLPDHKNAKSGKFVDRFRVQNPETPATTITSHISKDGHYFIHYDINQCRSLTVREAARIQTFPDNYFFCGTRTQQFHQVGNAVPPLLAKQIARIVFEILLLNRKEIK